MRLWKCIPPPYMENYDIPTDGHHGSYGSYTSNRRKKSFQKAFSSISWLIYLQEIECQGEKVFPAQNQRTLKKRGQNTMRPRNVAADLNQS